VRTSSPNCTLSSDAASMGLTGVAQPEAMVKEPSGAPHVVRVGDRIGAEGGYVQNIVRGRVVIELPNAEQPVVVSIAPDGPGSP